MVRSGFATRETSPGKFDVSYPFHETSRLNAEALWLFNDFPLHASTPSGLGNVRVLGAVGGGINFYLILPGFYKKDIAGRY
jgi:hypothetical protein